MNFAEIAGERRAVLRPVDPALSIRRLREWNEILDRAPDDSHAQDRAKARADELWLVAMKEQQWRFLGHLGDDTKTILDEKGDAVGVFTPGDMIESEKKIGETWR